MISHAPSFGSRFRGLSKRAPQVVRHSPGNERHVPTLAEQQAIVAEIEAEPALVAANRELITRME
jgi:hypothetical protein